MGKGIISFDYQQQYKTITGSPVLADLPVGTYQVFRNTATGDLEIWGNNNGVIEQITSGGGSQTLQQTLISPESNELKTDFIVHATAILRPEGAFTHGTQVTWSILNGSDGHKSSFYTSAIGNESDFGLTVKFPRVKNVLNNTITVDETLAGYGIITGATVAVTNFKTWAYISDVSLVRITGDGSGGFTKSVKKQEHSQSLNIAFDTGTGELLITNINTEVVSNLTSAMITYNGENRLTLKRMYAGVASNALKYVVYNSSGAVLTTNPTSTDEFILNLGMGKFAINPEYWYNNFYSGLWSANSNFWVSGLFEAWMIVQQYKTTSNKIRWQTDWPSATNYKIYRSTTANYTENSVTGMTLIHTGTSGEYIDTGLTPGTLYYYKLMATVGSDVEVTTFNCIAK